MWGNRFPPNTKENGSFSAYSAARPLNSGQRRTILQEFGQTECTLCPVGTFGRDSGATTCEVCPQGTFQDQVSYVRDTQICYGVDKGGGSATCRSTTSLVEGFPRLTNFLHFVVLAYAFVLLAVRVRCHGFLYPAFTSRRALMYAKSVTRRHHTPPPSRPRVLPGAGTRTSALPLTW